MIERDEAGRAEFLLEQHGEIADAATDVGDRHARPHSVTRQNAALVAPRHLGLRAQQADDVAVLDESLPRIELAVVFLDDDVVADIAQGGELAGGPADDARRDHRYAQVRPFAARPDQKVGQHLEGDVVEPHQALHVDVERSLDGAQRLVEQRRASGEILGPLRAH